MKYIKSYEQQNIQPQPKSYWMLPTDERFLKSLKEIGCTNDALYELSFKLNYIKNHHNINNKYIFISYNNYPIGWAWMPFDRKDFFEDANYKYMGAVNIPEYELSTLKYNI